MKLYEIDEELRNILDSMVIDEETGEILVDIDFDRIEELKLEKRKKIENLGLFYKELAHEIDAIKDEEKKLKERAASKQHKLDKLNEYLSYKLSSDPEYSSGFETSLVDMRFRKSKAVVIHNEDQIPKIYFRKKISLEPDKLKIKAAILANKKVRGAEVVEKNNLKIS